MTELETLKNKVVLVIHDDAGEIKNVVGRLVEISDNFLLLQINQDQTAIAKNKVIKIKMKEDKQNG